MHLKCFKNKVLHKTHQVPKDDNQMLNKSASLLSNKQANLEFPSLDLAFSLTQERIAGQLKRAETMDTKVSFVMASSTALISTALILHNVLLPSQSGIFSNKLLQELPLSLLLLVYLGVMVAACLAYRIRNYQQAPNPVELYEHYLSLPEEQTKAEVYRSMVETYKGNEKVLKKKVAWTKYTFFGMLVEALVLVLFLFLLAVI